MYHPTSRVLTVLELLQARPSITGPELADRLEMDVRTVRRYITHLQDVGIPIESTIGRHGGYRLRPGFKLPPLMFTTDEATAVVLGLLANSWLALELSAATVEGALAKVSRVLPQQARERLNAVSAHLTLFPDQQASRPDATLLINLSEAIQATQRVALAYRSLHNQLTQRKVEPYGITGWRGRWYLIGYCCLRQDYRTFRLDRIQTLEVLEEHFDRVESFDVRDYIARHASREANGLSIEIEFHAPLETVQQKIPASYGTLSTTPAGTLFQSQYEDMPAMARYLIYLNLPFAVHHPPELREALLQLSTHIAQVATNHVIPPYTAPPPHTEPPTESSPPQARLHSQM